MDFSAWKANLVMLSAGGVAVVGGMALTSVLASPAATSMFAWAGVAWLSAGLIGIAILIKSSRTNVVAYLYLSALSLNIGCNSMCLAMAIPILFAYPPLSSAGSALIAYAIGLSSYQAYRANQHFLSCWRANNQQAFHKCFDSRSGTLRIEEFIRRLELDIQLFLPVKSTIFRDFLYIALIISMTIGLNFREVYPEASALAWGIPSFTLANLLLQATLVRIRLAGKLLERQRSTETIYTPKI